MPRPTALRPDRDGPDPALSASPDPPPGTRVSYRFALRPWWIVSHLFVLVCIVAMVRLGFWQLARLDEVRTVNGQIAARALEVPLPVDAALEEVADVGVEAVEFRRIELTGTYLSGDQVLVRNRSLNSSPGYWVLTPLATRDGPVVVVNRGWVPIEVVAAGDDGPSAAPPVGDVAVTGVVRVAEQREGIGIADPPEGRLDTLSRVDVERLDAQVEANLAPFWVQLQEQVPAPGEIPVAVPLPERDDGMHLNYAGQWFIFATLTAIVYPLLLRRRAHKPAERADRPEVVADHRDAVRAGR